MALDKLTKIDGGGISTTSNYRVGVITATKFVGPIEGSITATDASFSGNVSIAGTLTYEDVTNVDSVGIITARTNILLGDSIKHLGDENTLISFPANDTITAHTSGSERLRITSSGRVAIGTDSSTSATGLTVYRDDTGGGNLVNIEQDGTGDAVLGFALKGTAAWQFGIDNSDSDKFKISYDGSGLDSSTSVTLDRTGKVGIGTAIPSSLLSLFSDAAGEELLFFDMGSPADRRGWKFEQKDTGTGTQLNLKSVGNGKSFIVSDSSDNITLRVHTSSTGGVAYNGAYISLYPLVGIGQTLAHIGDTDTKLEFPANNTIKFDTDGSQRLRINSDGRVLIGNDLTNSNNETTGNLVVDGGDNNIGGIQVHAGGGENSGDLAGITFSHGNSGTAARPKGAIAFECNASGYGRGDLCFYVDNTGDNNKVSNVDERVRFSGDGNVGIGTNDPKTKLNVYTHPSTDTGGILVQNVIYASNQDRPYLTVGTENWTGATTNWNTYGFAHKIKSDGSGVPRISIDTNAAEAFTLKNNGKIGINVTNPTEILHINGNFLVTGQIYQSTPADFWSQGNTFIELNGIGNITHMGGYEINITSNGYRDTNGQWVSYNTNSVGGASQIGLTPTGEIRFRTDASKADGTAHNPTTRVVIDSSGRVLIGGNSNSASSHADELQIINTSAQGGLSIINASNSQGNIYFGHSGGTADGRIEYSHQADYMRLFTANTERFRIDSSGRVGIGSVIPSAKLDVFATNGTIAQFGDPRNASFECIRIKNNEAGYPAISQDSSSDTLDLRSMGSVQATIDANNNSTGKYFRVVHNGQGNSGTVLFNVADNGTVYIPRGVVSLTRQGGSNFIEVGSGQNANNYAYIDFVGDSTYTDYGLRLIRSNGGANTSSQLIHRGTGTFSIQTTEAAQIDFRTSGGNNRLSIEAGGNVGINTSNPDHRFHVYHPTINTVAKFESGDAGCGMLFKDLTATTRIEQYNTEFKIDHDTEGLLADSSRHINLDLNGTTKLSVHHEGVRIGNNVTGTPNQMLHVDGNIYLGPNNTNRIIHSGAALGFTADSNIYFVCDSNDTSGTAPGGEFIWGGGSNTNTDSNADFTEAEFGNGFKPRNQYMYLNESALRPTSSGGINLGSSSYRWGTIYTDTSVNTSDRNEKKEIIDCDLGLDFICKLNPVSFKWKTERNKKADTKVHYGLIAQDVEDVILSEGKTLDEFGAVDKSEEEEASMGLSYSELIAPMIKALQEANEKIKILETEVAALKSL